VSASFQKGNLDLPGKSPLVSPNDADLRLLRDLSTVTSAGRRECGTIGRKWAIVPVGMLLGILEARRPLLITSHVVNFASR